MANISFRLEVESVRKFIIYLIFQILPRKAGAIDFKVLYNYLIIKKQIERLYQILVILLKLLKILGNIKILFVTIFAFMLNNLNLYFQHLPLLLNVVEYLLLDFMNYSLFVLNGPADI